MNQRERVAVAIRDEVDGTDLETTVGDLPWDEIPDDYRSWWLSIAEKALDAARPSNESLEDKAAAIVAEGRLRVRTIRPDGLIVAHVQGRTGEYDLGFDPTKREWRCTCPVLRRQNCSHLAALRLVVDEPAPANQGDTTRGGG